MTTKLNKYRSNKRQRKILDSVRFPLSGRMLDASCGDGSFVALIHKDYPELELFGTDVSFEKIREASNDHPFAHFTQSDSESLPFADLSFDVVFCGMSFHHYKNLGQVLEEFARVLKAEGRLYVLDVVPKNRFSQRVYNYFGCYEPYHFEKFYTIHDLEEMGLNAGFSLKRIERLGVFPRVVLGCFVRR